MAVESSKETAEDQVGPLIDDLIRDIFAESGGSSESSVHGMASTAALLHTAWGSTRGSMFERLLIAEVFASELAEALAPALAEQIAPRLMKALEQRTSGEAPAKKPAPASRSGTHGRKPDTKLRDQVRERHRAICLATSPGAYASPIDKMLSMRRSRRLA